MHARRMSRFIIYPFAWDFRRNLAPNSAPVELSGGWRKFAGLRQVY